MARAVHGWRRVLRWVGRGALALVALVIVAIGAALVAIHTDWGRERVRREVVSILGKTFRGKISIGRLEGSPFTELVLRDVVIEDAAGRRAIVIDRIGAEVALWDLIHERVHVRALDVDGVDVLVREDAGEFNLATLTVPSQKDSGPEPWSIAVDRAMVRDARVDVVAAGHAAHLDDVAIDAGAALPAGDAIETHVELRGRWRETGTPVSIAAELRKDGEVLEVARAHAAIGEVALFARDVRVHGVKVSGTVLAVATPHGARLIVPASPLDGATSIVATIASTNGGRLSLALAGLAGGASIFGGGTVDVGARRVNAAVEVRSANGATIARGLPPSAIDALAVVALGPRATGDDATALAAFDVDAILLARGNVRGARVTSLGVGLALHGAGADVAVRAAAPGATAVAFDGRLELERPSTKPPARALANRTPAARAPGPLVLELRSATFTMRSRDLHAFGDGALSVRGRIAIDLAARGRVAGGPSVAALAPAPVLAVEGRVIGDELDAAGFHAHRAVVDLDGTSLPFRPDGRVRARLDGIAHDGQIILAQLVADIHSRPDRRLDVHTHTEPPDAAWIADLDAIADVTPARATIELGQHRIRTRGVDWTGGGGTVTVDRESIVARGVSTDVEGGHVELDATLARAGANAGDADAKVCADHVDLAAVARALGAGQPIAGAADGTVDVSRRAGRLRGAVDVHARGLVTRKDAPAIDLDAEAQLAPGDVDVTLEVAGDQVGKASAHLAIAAPAKLEDARAWRGLPRHALREAKIVLERVDAARLAQVAGTGAVTAGGIDGTIELAGGADATGAVTIRGLAGPALPVPLDAKLALSTDAHDLSANLEAHLRGLVNAKADVKTALPDHPFSPATWTAVDARDFHGAHLHVDGDLHDQALTRQLGLVTPWRGTGAADLSVEPSLGQARLAIKLERFSGGAVVEPIDADVQVALDEHGLAGRALTIFKRRPLIDVQVSSTVTPAQLLAAIRDPKAFGALPIGASISADRIPIAQLLRATGRGGEPVSGEASISAVVDGTVADPRAKVFASFASLGAGDAIVTALRATATYQDRKVDVAIDGNEQKGGTLSLAVRADLAHLDQATTKLQAKGFDLAPLARLAPPSIGIGGTLDADLALTGTDVAGKLGGTLHLTNGELPLHPLVGTLRGGDVTVKVDGGAIDIAAKGEVGRGTIEVKAKTQIAGLVPQSGTADITIHQVTLVNESQPQIDGTAHVQLAHQNGWDVKVGLDHVLVTLPEAKGQALHPTSVPAEIVIVHGGGKATKPQGSAVVGRRPAQPYLTAHVDLGHVRVESKQLRGTLSGNLTATVGHDAIAIDGAVDAGTADVTISDRRYRVDKASVRFDGGIDPLLDVRISYDFPEMTLYASVQGRLSKPQLALASDPSSYSQSELLGFLIGGEPGQAPAAGVSDVAAGIASSLLSSKVKGLTERYTGVGFDVLKLETATSSSSAALTVGKWITRKLFVSYVQHVDARYDENSSQAEAEYWLGHRIVLDGTAGDRGVDDLDLVWTRRW